MFLIEVWTLVLVQSLKIYLLVPQEIIELLIHGLLSSSEQFSTVVVLLASDV